VTGEELACTIRAALGRDPALRLLVLFGSGARGELRPDSDVDVGIIPRDRDVPLRFELDLAALLSRACGRQVDVVRLDHASPLLAWQVARAAVPVLADPPTEHSRFVARATSAYLDAEPAMRAAAKVYARRLSEAG